MVEVTPLAAWMNEREAIRLRKEMVSDGIDNWDLSVLPLGRKVWGDHPKDYWTLDHLTDDPILHQFRFCNVRRQDDRVTRWITEHISEPFADHEYLWLMLAIARTINWPNTLKKLMYAGCWPDHPKWAPFEMTTWLDRFKARGDKVYTGAYMIRAESDPKAAWYSWTKQRYVAEIVIGKLWEARHDWQHLNGPGVDQLQGVWEYFQMFTGWGPFMAGQVVTDLRWTRYLRDAPDLNKWTALGPGSRRGLNRLYGRSVIAPLSQEKGLAEMLEVREALTSRVLASWFEERPELSDVQNCLCEFDKYERVRLGEGRPRALYVPGRGH